MFATLPLPKPSSSNNNGDPSSSATLQKTQSVRAGPPSKPPRKKRPAPLPPVATSMKQNSVNQSQNIKETKTKEISVDVLTAVVHSRTSSHSSGFNETTSSPLESPGNSSHDSTARVADIAEERTKTKPESSVVTDNLPSRDSIPEVVSIEITEPCLSNSTIDGDGDSSTLRRKRKAPRPPPGGE